MPVNKGQRLALQTVVPSWASHFPWPWHCSQPSSCLLGGPSTPQLPNSSSASEIRPVFPLLCRSQTLKACETLSMPRRQLPLCRQLRQLPFAFLSPSQRGAASERSLPQSQACLRAGPASERGLLRWVLSGGECFSQRLHPTWGPNSRQTVLIISGFAAHKDSADACPLYLLQRAYLCYTPFS